jgi:hypothetical protein
MQCIEQVCSSTNVLPEVQSKELSEALLSHSWSRPVRVRALRLCVYVSTVFPLYLMMRPHVEMKNKSMYLPVLLDVDWAVVVFFHRRIALVGLLAAGVVARLGLVHVHVLTSCLRRLP